MGIENVTVFAAFIAGLLSFISPCVLPLIPVYLGYLSGSTITGDEAPLRSYIFTHALMFVGGFTLIFVTFGALAGLLGSVLNTFADYLVWIGGILLIIFGLHIMGIITIPLFNMQKKLEYGYGQAPDYARSLIVGMTFAAGWTPCIGPILGTILTLGFNAASQANPTTAVIQVAAFLFVYSAGLAVPFLATAWMLTAATSRLKMLYQHMALIERLSGAFIIIIGVLLVTGKLSDFNSYVRNFAPVWLLENI